jgi:hypothetical protein
MICWPPVTLASSIASGSMFGASALAAKARSRVRIVGPMI